MMSENWAHQSVCMGVLINVCVSVKGSVSVHVQVTAKIMEAIKWEIESFLKADASIQVWFLS